MAEELEKTLREIIGEDGTLGMNSSEENWNSDRSLPQGEQIGMDSEE